MSSDKLVVTDLKEHFAAEGVAGAFLAYDARATSGWIYQPELANTPFLPASTFKIPHAIIALETGILPNADHVLPWDGERRWHPQWNLDLNLHEAVRLSAVPFFQQVARKVGSERMTKWLGRLGYGNENIEGKIDWFWLVGGLRISSAQQVDFLQRLRSGALPIADRTRNVVRDVLFFGRRGARTIYGKTGSTDPENSAHNVHWFVGWVEQAERATYFATLIVDPPSGKSSARLHVTDRILSALDVL